MIIHRYELTDEQWDKIESLFPPYTRGRPARHDNRKMLNAILWINRTGAPWRDLPERYGSWKTVYMKLTRWAREGVLECLFRVLASDADMELIQLQSVRINTVLALNKAVRKRKKIILAVAVTVIRLKFML